MKGTDLPDLYAPPRSHRTRRPAPAGTRWRIELALGAVLVTAVALLGLALSGRVGPTIVDRWGDALLAGRNGPWDRAVSFGSSSALVVGTVVVTVAAIWRRSARRLLACALGPVLAVASAELFLKPAVGRHLVGVFTYPSGTVVVVASLSAAAVLGLRGAPRLVAGVGAAVATVLTVVAVVALRWHYPTDACAGVAWGVGVVLVLDALLSARRFAPR